MSGTDSTPPPDPTELIDRAAIARADAERDAALARAHQARLAHAQAEATLRDANAAADACARDGGDLHAAQDRVDAVERSLKITKRALDAATAAASEAPSLHRQAIGKAHRNAAMAAINARLAACRAGEAARLALTQAEQDFRAATATLAGFRAAGWAVQGLSEILPTLWPRAEAADLAVWSANYHDVLANHFHGES